MSLVYFRFDDPLAPPISTMGRDWLQATAAMRQRQSFDADRRVDETDLRLLQLRNWIIT
jgi:hypothetical protein